MIDFIGTALVFGVLATVIVVMIDIYLHLDDDNFGV